MGPKLGADEAIARLAARQHGVVARRQLDRLGIGGRAIAGRIRQGRLRRIHRGVYAVGHDGLTPQGRWMAAVLAAGAEAVLSHRSAAALWGIGRGDGSPEVTAPHGGTLRGVRLHRSFVARDERTRRNGIPVTTVGRTLIDLAPMLPEPRLERMHREAEVLKLPIDLERLVERHPRRPGIRAARGLLGETITKSELEARFLKFLRRYGLPTPETNEDLPFGEADCVWRAQRLNVELDGGGVHRTRSAFERDRARDRAATLAGWRVIRVTWRQLRDEPERLARDLRALLAVPTA